MELILAEDWFLYYADKHGFMWQYNTEMWEEWDQVEKGSPVSVMAQFRGNYMPTPVAKIDCDYIVAKYRHGRDHATKQEFVEGAKL
jgi:hypothetical protein